MISVHQIACYFWRFRPHWEWTTHKNWMQDEFRWRVSTGFLLKGSPIATSSRKGTTSLYQDNKCCLKYEAPRTVTKWRAAESAEKTHRSKRRNPNWIQMKTEQSFDYGTFLSGRRFWRGWFIFFDRIHRCACYIFIYTRIYMKSTVFLKAMQNTTSKFNSSKSTDLDSWVMMDCASW